MLKVISISLLLIVNAFDLKMTVENKENDKVTKNEKNQFYFSGFIANLRN